MRTCNDIIEDIGPAKPTARCRVSDWRGLHEEETDERGDGTGINWLGDPIDVELVEELYPTRELFQCEGLSPKERKEAVAAYERQLAQSGGDPADLGALQAVAHFRGAEFDEDDDGQPAFQVYVGDYVELRLEDRPKGVAQVVELYQDPLGTRRLRLHWFYSIHDDEVKLLLSGKDRDTARELAGYDPHRLWRARERDSGAYQVEFELKNIERKVEVRRVELGQAPPTDGSYWWDSEIGAICYTIERPLDREAPSKQKFADRPRLLRVMDLYAGGGGFGYMDTRSQLGSGRDRVEVRTDWAVDYEADMAATFKANFQHTHVFTSGADEWLSLCKEIKRLCDKHGVGPESEDPENKQAFAWDQLGRRDDDRLVEPPRSLVLEQRGRKGKRSKESAADQANAAATAKEDAKGNSKGKGKKRAAEEQPPAEDDSNVIVIESSEEVVVVESEGAGAAPEDVEEAGEDDNAPGPSTKRARLYSSGGKAPAAAKPAAKKGGKQSAGKKGGAGDEQQPLSPRALKRREHFDVAGEEARGIQWPADSHVPAAKEVDQVLAVRLCEKAPRQPDKGVTAKQLVREIQESECRLEFKVCWSSGEEPSWLPECALGACQKQLTAFCKQLRRNQAIPFPGEVDLICGGPPCQGVSGNNRHAAMTDILKDVRNRQLTVFLATVDWFQPAFVLMENVQDILKKEEGAYIKYALSHLLQNGHQVRLALLAAGDYGQCQGRWRCFLWGARSGEQLPAYPEATHNCRNFNTAVGTLGKVCQGGFLSAESAEHAYPAVLMGDILADLPAVENGELRERLPYDKDPVYAQQCWLRRRPHAWQTSVADRLAFRACYMGPEAKQLNKSLVLLGDQENFVALGLKALNNKNPLVGAKDTKGRKGSIKQREDGRQEGNHVFETLDAVYHKLAAKDKGMAQVLRLQWEGSRLSYAHERGKEFHRELQQALAADAHEDPGATLTDQRSLALNEDDHLRITRVPPRETYDQFVNFRSMEGLVTHPDGQCCYGHQHAYIQNGSSACPGGGSYAKPSKEQKSKAVRDGLHHKMRVDESDKNGLRMVSLPGCPAFTKFLPTMDPEVPRWCVTFKEGRSNGRHGGYGRVHYAGVVSTVLGRAEPHNLELAHPRQHRVLTIRENARAQGFPDYHVFCAKVGTKSGRWVRNQTLVQRYQMIGNAVCPAVAAALGRCLALAAVGESPPGQEFISVPDEEYDEVIAQAREEGLSFFYEDYCAEHEKGFKAVPLEARLCAMAATGSGAPPAAAADTEGNGSEAEEEGEEEDDDFESANSDGEDE